MPQESLKKLYDAGSQHYDLGDLPTFMAKMRNADSRKKFYDSLSQHYDLGGYDVFNSKVDAGLAEGQLPITGKPGRIASVEDLLAGKNRPEVVEADRHNIPPSPEIAKRLAQPVPPTVAPEVDDSFLGSLKRSAAGIVETAGQIPAGFESLGRLQQRAQKAYLKAIGAPEEFRQVAEKEIAERRQMASEPARAAKELSEKYIGAKPGSPKDFAAFTDDPLGVGARLAIETIPMTALLAGATAVNPAAGAAILYGVEAGESEGAFDELEKQGVKVDPLYRDLAVVGKGALNAALEKVGIDKILEKVKIPGLKGRLFKILSSTTTEGITEGLQEVNQVLAEAGTKLNTQQAITLKNVFDVALTELGKNSSRIQEATLGGTIAGGGTSALTESLRPQEGLAPTRQEQISPPATPSQVQPLAQPEIQPTAAGDKPIMPAKKAPVTISLADESEVEPPAVESAPVISDDQKETVAKSVYGKSFAELAQPQKSLISKKIAEAAAKDEETRVSAAVKNLFAPKEEKKAEKVASQTKEQPEPAPEATAAPQEVVPAVAAPTRQEKAAPTSTPPQTQPESASLPAQQAAPADAFLKNEKTGTDAEQPPTPPIERVSPPATAPERAKPEGAAPAAQQEAEQAEKQVAANVQRLPITDIATDVDRFQNRASDFSEKTAATVAERFDPNLFDPIVVWRDPANGKTFVLSGHSRLEGMKRRGEKNIPARYFEGDEQAAMNYAQVQANRLGTAENLSESIKAYRTAKAQNLSRAKLKDLFDGDLDFLDAAQNLDQKGDFVNILNQPAAAEFPYIKRFSRWVGELRGKYADKLTDRHEQQIFDWLYKGGNRENINSPKTEFFDKIENQISRFDFSPDDPLSLEVGRQAVTGTRARKDTAALERKLTELREDRKRARTVAETEAIDKDIARIQKGLAEIVKTQPDLFSALEEKTVAPTQKKTEPVATSAAAKPESPESQPTAKNYDRAVEIFNRVIDRSRNKPTEAQQEAVREELEAAGVHPIIIQELTEPKRSPRPEESDFPEEIGIGDAYDFLRKVESKQYATTRNGRIESAIDPPAELKSKVDAIADAGKAMVDAEASLEQAKKDIIGEIESRGGEVVVNTDTGAFTIKLNTGKAKMGLQDILALKNLRKEAAEAGAYSLATVGRGFEIAVTPEKVAEAKSLTGTFAEKAKEFIRRNQAEKDAGKALDAAKKDARNELVDHYLAERTAEREPRAFKGTASDGTAAQVLIRRNRSAVEPDIAVGGRDFPAEIQSFKEDAATRSERGKPFISTRETGKKTFAEALKAGRVVDTASRAFGANNTIVTRKELDDAFASLAKKVKLNTGIDPSTLPELLKIGTFYVEGGIREFGAWSDKMVASLTEKVNAAFAERVKPQLKIVWDEIKKRRPGLFKAAKATTAPDLFSAPEPVAPQKPVAEKTVEPQATAKPMVIQGVDVTTLSVAERLAFERLMNYAQVAAANGQNVRRTEREYEKWLSVSGDSLYRVINFARGEYPRIGYTEAPEKSKASAPEATAKAVGRKDREKEIEEVVDASLGRFPEIREISPTAFYEVSVSGTTIGDRYKSRDEAITAISDRRKKQGNDFRKKLDAMTDDQFKSQRLYWYNRRRLTETPVAETKVKAEPVKPEPPKNILQAAAQKAVANNPAPKHKIDDAVYVVKLWSANPTFSNEEPTGRTLIIEAIDQKEDGFVLYRGHERGEGERKWRHYFVESEIAEPKPAEKKPRQSNPFNRVPPGGWTEADRVPDKYRKQAAGSNALESKAKSALREIENDERQIDFNRENLEDRFGKDVVDYLQDNKYIVYQQNNYSLSGVTAKGRGFANIFLEEKPSPNILQQAAKAATESNKFSSDIVATKFGGTLPDGRKLVAKNIATRNGAQQGYVKDNANREIVEYKETNGAQRFAVVEKASDPTSGFIPGAGRLVSRIGEVLDRLTNNDEGTEIIVTRAAKGYDATFHYTDTGEDKRFILNFDLLPEARDWAKDAIKIKRDELASTPRQLMWSIHPWYKQALLNAFDGNSEAAKKASRGIVNNFPVDVSANDPGDAIDIIKKNIPNAHVSRVLDSILKSKGQPTSMELMSVDRQDLVDAEPVNLAFNPRDLAKSRDAVMPTQEQRAWADTPYKQALLNALGGNRVLAQDALDGIGEKLPDNWNGTIQKQRAAKQAIAEYVMRDEDVERVFKALQDAEERGTTVVTEPKQEERKSTAASDNFRSLANLIKMRLERNAKLDNPALTALAEEAFGGTRAQGTYSAKDAYDALELAVNEYIAENGDELMTQDSKASLKWLRELMAKLPRQTDRTLEQDQFQQFSTPPTQAFVAAKILNPQQGEVVLEPSAGVGGLAVFPKLAGANVHTNEISPRRADLLKMQGYPVTKVDAEIINDVLPDNIRPTAILMNPPFSATGGRVLQNKTSYGAKHVESALQRLENNGRLVAIVGQGMALDKPTFTSWWQRIAQKYNVRANIGIPGDEYSKYGTTFDNQIIVIDKTGATPGNNWAEQTNNIVKGDVENLEEALNVTAKITADRKAVAQPVRPETGERPLADRAGSVRTGVGEQSPEVGRRERVVESGKRPGRDTSGTGESGSQTGAKTLRASEPRNKSEQAARESGRTARTENLPNRSGRVEDVGESSGERAATESIGIPGESSGLESGATGVIRESEASGKFVRYKPAKLRGGVEHPANIVESSSMAAVDPPDIKYQASLPASIIKEGKLSGLQLETVHYSGQQFDKIMPNGQRMAFFLGDGTGVGKGRQISGVVGDQWNKGVKKILWVSASRDLMEDATRDVNDLGLDIPINSINDYSPSGNIDAPQGIIFSTYQSLIAESRGETRQTRQAQLEKWLGNNSLIIFDEAHKAKNALAVGSMGEPSQTAQAVIGIQNNLPKARVLYSSATGATDVRNMAYMTRLGLWGPGTAFPDGFMQFLQEIDSGGVGAMEMVSRDMKALGMYASRSISFEGVDYRETIHELTPEQRNIYNVAAQAWQTVLQNIDEALGITNASAMARARALSRFWGDHQRFFKQVVTALKVPTAIKEVDQALKDGKSVVLSVIGTGESRTKELIARSASEGKSLEELDFSPREVIANLVDHSFPTDVYQDQTDPDTGKTIKVLVKDAGGNPVQSREAIALKERLLDQLSDLNLPENPLDQVVNYYGVEKVAEMTGRKRRLIRNPKTGKTEYVTRAPDGVAMNKTNLYEMKAFQDGRKNVAIISDAAATGISLHASNRAKNKQRRVHITLELGWSADKQMQTFGRTHRSDQASAPEYVLLSTDVGGEKRFSSTIARRLASLGALTKGQRDATGGGDLAKYNFETQEGAAAVSQLYSQAMGEEKELGIENPRQALRDMGVLKPGKDGSEDIKPDDRTDVTKFLNRVLALDIDRQNKLFDGFIKNFEGIVQSAKDNGTFDDGVADIKGESIRLVGKPEIVHRDKATGAETLHYHVEVDVKTEPLDFNEAGKILKNYKASSGAGFYTNDRSGNVFLATPSGSQTNQATGRVENKFRLIDPKNNYRWITEAELADKFTASNAQDAKTVWDEKIASIPKIETEEKHIIGGAILPLWQKLKTQNVSKLKVVRVTTDSGKRIVGIVIPDESLGSVLRSIGVSRSLRGAPEIFKAVFEQGDSVELAGGLTLTKSRIHGDDAIELAGVDYSRQNEMRNLGLLNERIDWKQRFFIPTDERKGIKILTDVIERYPAVSGEGEKSTLSRESELLDDAAEESSRKKWELTPEKAESLGRIVARTSSKEPRVDSPEIAFYGKSRLADGFIYRGTETSSEIESILRSGNILSSSETAKRLNKSKHKGKTFFSDYPNIASSYINRDGFLIELKTPTGFTAEGGGEISVSESLPISSITRIFRIGKDGTGMYSIDVTDEVLSTASSKAEIEGADATVNKIEKCRS